MENIMDSNGTDQHVTHVGDIIDVSFDGENAEVGDVVDPATGLPRLLEDKCPTCIYRPGNLMHLTPGRREQMEREAIENGSWIVCHSTLPANEIPVGEQAICRGFWDVNKNNSWGCRLAQGLDGPVEVPLPSIDLDKP